MLNLFDELSDDDVAVPRRARSWTRRQQQSMAVIRRSKKKRGFPADDASLRICEVKSMSRLV